MKRPARLLTLLVLLIPLLAACGERARTELVICSSLPLNGGANSRAVARMITERMIYLVAAAPT